MCIYCSHCVYNQCLPSVNLSGTNTQICCLSAFVNRCLNWAFHLSVTSVRLGCVILPKKGVVCSFKYIL